MRVCNNCYADIEKLESSDEEDEYQDFHDHIDDAMSELGEQSAAAESNLSINATNSSNTSTKLHTNSDLYSDSPKALHGRYTKDERLFDTASFVFTDESDSEDSDDSVIHYPNRNSGNSNNITSGGSVTGPISNNTNANYNKWDGRSRSPSRSRNSFRRHRSGTSLSIDQAKIMRMGPRKKSFTSRPKPSFSSSTMPPFKTLNGISPSSPLYDLNNASIAHSKAFLRQVLEHQGMPGKLGKWIDALMPPLLQCISHIDLDLKIFEGSDFRSFVKLKRIPGGLPSHSQYIDGVVFSQILTMKSMPQHISNPSILLARNLFEHPRLHVSKILEISRQELSRYDTLIQRVAQLKPHIILTTGGAGRSILKRFDQMGIAVLTHVKDSVIERVSLYTHATISTYESLSFNTALGHCSRFDVKTFRYENKVKKYIFLSGIPKELGCTVVLRGADMESLATVKKIVQFMVYIMFNLKLETSLLREEYTFVPDTPPLLKEIARRLSKNGLESPPTDPSGDPSEIDTTEMEGKILSTSPFVNYGLPYLLQVARQSEDQLVEMDQDKNTAPTLETINQILQSVGLDVNHIPGNQETITKMADFLYQEVSKRLYDNWSKQTKQWKNSFLRDQNMFTPEFHLKMVLLYSSVCTETLTPCFGPEILTFRFYNDKQDMPLGHFIERLCLDANALCSEGCGRTLKHHTRSYAHNDGNITISINDHPCNLPGMSDSILMWSTCKECRVSTPILPMSDDTWKYSLGKYFELSFWSSELSFREHICPHNLYRSHVRFFGFKNMAVSIEYNPIVPYEVVLPPSRMEWQPERGMKLKVSCYSSIVESIEKFYNSVALRINSVKVDELPPENIDECRIKVHELLARIDEEQRAVISDLDRIFINTDPTAYLPLNSVLRTMQDHAISWDFEFVEFENNFFPSEKDITRLTAAHLRKIFLPDDIYEKRHTIVKTDVDESVGDLVEKSRKNSAESTTIEITNEKVDICPADTSHDMGMEMKEFSSPPKEPLSGSVTARDVTEKKEATNEKDKLASSEGSLDDLVPQPKDTTETLPISDQKQEAAVDTNDFEKSIPGKEQQKNDISKIHEILESKSETSAIKPQVEEGDDPAIVSAANLSDLEGANKQKSDALFSKKAIATPTLTVGKQILPSAERETKSSSEFIEQLSAKLNNANSPSNIPRAKSNLDVSFGKGKSLMRLSTDSIPDLSSRGSLRGGTTRSPSPTSRREPLGRVQEAISLMEQRQPLSSTNSTSITSTSLDKTSTNSSIPLFSDTFGTSPDNTNNSTSTGNTNTLDHLEDRGGMSSSSAVAAAASSSQLTFKARHSSIPVLKHPSLERHADGNSSSPDRMMEYAKIRLKYNPPKAYADEAPLNNSIPVSKSLAMPSTAASLSNNLKFQSKFDKIGYTGGTSGAFRPRFGSTAVRDMGLQWISSANRGPDKKSVSVSSLAKHFEQLSREFELERARERRMLAQTQYRAVPVATSKPIVEVYKNVKEAVEELSQSEDEDEDDQENDSDSESEDESGKKKRRKISKTVPHPAAGFVSSGEDPGLGRETMVGEGNKNGLSVPQTQKDSIKSPRIDGKVFSEHNAVLPDDLNLNNTDEDDGKQRLKTDHDTQEIPVGADDSMKNDNIVENGEGGEVKITEPLEAPIEPETSLNCPGIQTPGSQVEDSNLQQTERQGLLQSLASFWADRSATGWRPLDYPLYVQYRFFIFILLYLL